MSNFAKIKTSKPIMSNKLQELTDKLYQEGLSKGRQDGQQFLDKAKEEAASIIEAARKEAAAIVDAANKEAQQLKVKTESDLKMASIQTIAKVRQQVENSVITKAVAEPVKNAFADQSFIREILSTVVKSFNASNPESACLDVILPEKVRKELGEKAASQIIAELGKGLEVSFSKKIESGFKIGPKEGGYQISFSGEDFSEMFSEYLRPAARKILFGE